MSTITFLATVVACFFTVASFFLALYLEFPKINERLGQSVSPNIPSTKVDKTKGIVETLENRTRQKTKLTTTRVLAISALLLIGGYMGLVVIIEFTHLLGQLVSGSYFFFWENLFGAVIWGLISFFCIWRALVQLRK